MMTMRNLFTFSRSYNNVCNAINQYVCSPVRYPASPINAKAKHFSTTPVSYECIKFKNHDDFVKKVFVENDVPVLVDFHADWCEPSKKLTKHLLEKIENRKDIGLVIVNVENHIDLVHTFEVKAVPAILAVKNGLVVYKCIGLVEINVIEDILDQISGKKQAIV